ncbi:winged helix-turn-helix domain-containing tetratricopeptide repeat protein [Novosphingobium tardum]|uniref:Winged helix-turn-helix domain-containing tetratricopeptide repeat protein n=1 Tax=Novosphingobium tardum TaxID=1538021 RepID=A0ABV8RL92_9SPHN
MATREIKLGRLTLQPDRQLLADGAPVPLTRKPLQILTALANARGALVTKDELLDAVWPSQLVEEAALQVHIVALRKALGAEAELLKTVHGFGYRLDVPGLAATSHTNGSVASGSQPSIAVLPLRLLGGEAKHALIAEALPHELISELSRLHWLFVIARASSFQFRDAEPDIAGVGATLGVKYCLSGTLEPSDNRLAITVDLVDTRTLGVIWGDRFLAPIEAIHETRSRIVASIISALEFHIPVYEAHAATTKSTEDLDAWGLYHLALQRVFRSTAQDNAAACDLFEQAAARDPSFARAHAGLSFTHFQNAFMRYVPNAENEKLAARRHADRAVELDAADPFANLVLGRAHWLTGKIWQSLPWIDRALTLNPNYAQASYAHALTDSILCEGAEGQRHADRAMALSPIDPMNYAMMGSRALSHAVRGEHAEAADWAERAARAPNSHVLIAMISVLCHALAGRDAAARRWAGAVRAGSPAISVQDFFRAFPFERADIRRTFTRALMNYGF